MKQYKLLRMLPPWLLLALCLVPGGPTAAAGETVVGISVPAEVNPGEQFSIGIQVEPGEAIAGMQFDLAFDASLLTVDGVTEGDLLSQDGAATYFSSGTIDNDAGTITGAAGAITTPGATVSGEGSFAVITMTAASSGGTAALTLSNVVVGDSNGQPVTIIVTSGEIAINRAPALTAIGAKATDEGQLLEFTITAADADGDPLVYATTDLPVGASFDPDTQTFSWMPRYDQAGTYSVHFEVSDGQLTDAEDVTITVSQPSEDWDVNGDGSANVLDMVLIGQHWGQSGLTGWIIEDANEDGSISVLDMIIIGQNWTG